MIFKEVAIEPAYLSNWDRLKETVDQCGFNHGRLIADFPKNKWQWQVVESCKDCLPREKSLIVEYLKNVKPRLIRRGRTFIEQNDWIENAKREHTGLPFHVVVTCDPHPGFPDFIEGVELHSGHGKWKDDKGDVIVRVAESMAAEAKELLVHAKEVVFIDPNYEPKSAYNKPLNRFITLASQGTQLSRMEYHLEHDSPEEYFSGKLKEIHNLRRLSVPHFCGIQFIRWKSLNSMPRDAMHPRYLLTDLGGLRYDYGLCEGNDGETTDVQIIEKGGAIYQQRWTEFNAGSTSFDFIDGFELAHQGIFKLAIQNGRFIRCGAALV